MKKLLIMPLVALLVWMLISLIHFAWFILDVDTGFGIWVGLRLIFFIVFIIGQLILGISFITTNLLDDNQSFLTKLKYLFGGVIVLLIANAIQLAPEILIRKKLTDTENIQSKIDEYIANSEIKMAFDYLDENIKKAESAIIWPSKFWVFDYLYFKTKRSERKRYGDLRSAYLSKGITNYLLGTSSNVVPRSLNKSVEISKRYLEDDYEMQFVPNLVMAQHYIFKNQFDSVDHYFSKANELLHVIDPVDGFETYFNISYSYYLIKVGRNEEGQKLMIKSLGFATKN